MTASDARLTSFERAVVFAILQDEAPDYLAHLENLQATKRTSTGKGMYVDLLDNSAPEMHSPPTLGASLFAEIRGMEHGAGMLLYIDDGKITMLELFSHANENWPEQVEFFALRRLSRRGG